MAATCPGCNKFPALEFQEPEVNEVAIDGNEVRCEVRLVRTTECCGDEFKEATLEATATLEGEEVAKHVDVEGHDLDAQEVSCEGTERSEGKGRYTRSFFGFSLVAKVSCSCGKFEKEVTLADDVQASGMDECC